MFNFIIFLFCCSALSFKEENHHLYELIKNGNMVKEEYSKNVLEVISSILEEEEIVLSDIYNEQLHRNLGKSYYDLVFSYHDFLDNYGLSCEKLEKLSMIHYKISLNTKEYNNFHMLCDLYKDVVNDFSIKNKSVARQYLQIANKYCTNSEMMQVSSK